MSTTYRPTVVTPPPGAVRAADAALKLWGDEASGFVNDWIYVSNEKIQQLVFSLSPGERFRHSERHRTNLGADELFYVLSGVLLLANPETGEVHRVERGDAVWFGPNTWHHGVSHGTETLRVLEFFAPPPATGSSQPYANTKPYLSSPTYTQDDLLGDWPAGRDRAHARHTQHVLRRADLLWRLEGDEGLPVGILLSTPELTCGSIELLPGQRTGVRTHGGDCAGYVVEGRLNLLLPEGVDGSPGKLWFQMERDDGFFVPAGVPYRLFNMTDAPVHVLFGVAPTYLAGA
ncbi:MAG TPA: cupin domain-containing protein [Gaiellaceae bacterium]|nr:cupin domain-containing protein [Gaiellaceae bacterium]